MGSRSYSFDANMLLSDGSAAATASGVATVGGSAAIIDLGGDQSKSPALNARIDAYLVIFLQALTTTNTNNVYTLILQGSNDPAFGAGNVQNLGMMDFGNTTARLGSALTTPAPTGSGSFGVVPSGQMYELGFTNEQNETMFEFLRLQIIVAGTNPSIQLAAFVAVTPEP